MKGGREGQREGGREGVRERERQRPGCVYLCYAVSTVGFKELYPFTELQYLITVLSDFFW